MSLIFPGIVETPIATGCVGVRGGRGVRGVRIGATRRRRIRGGNDTTCAFDFSEVMLAKTIPRQIAMLRLIREGRKSEDKAFECVYNEIRLFCLGLKHARSVMARRNNKPLDSDVGSYETPASTFLDEFDTWRATQKSLNNYLPLNVWARFVRLAASWLYPGPDKPNPSSISINNLKNTIVVMLQHAEFSTHTFLTTCFADILDNYPNVKKYYNIAVYSLVTPEITPHITAIARISDPYTMLVHDFEHTFGMLLSMDNIWYEIEKNAVFKMWMTANTMRRSDTYMQLLELYLFCTIHEGIGEFLNLDDMDTFHGAFDIGYVETLLYENMLYPLCPPELRAQVYTTLTDDSDIAEELRKISAISMRTIASRSLHVFRASHQTRTEMVYPKIADQRVFDVFRAYLKNEQPDWHPFFRAILTAIENDSPAAKDSPVAKRQRIE